MTTVHEEVEEEEVEDLDALIVNPFDPEKIDVVTKTPNVNLLLSRLRTQRLDLEPDFQRKSGIWNQRGKSRLIESLLLKIPLPTMYAAESRGDDDTWIVVDGVQRLSTIASFVEPSLFPGSDFEALSGLEYLQEFNGKTYSDLGLKLQTRIQETEFVMNLIRRGTPEPVMFNIFARINTGGAPLTRQELRHALTPGAGREILKTLADGDAFKHATGGNVRPDRMADREMILRFASFYLRGVEAYDRTTDFDSFLTDGMKLIGTVSDAKRKKLTNSFEEALNTSSLIFEDHAFRKSLPGYERKAPINKALFEAVSVSLARMTKAERKSSIANREQVIANFHQLFNDDDEFMASISQGTGDPPKVQRRHTKVTEALL